MAVGELNPEPMPAGEAGPVVAGGHADPAHEGLRKASAFASPTSLRTLVAPFALGFLGAVAVLAVRTLLFTVRGRLLAG